MKELSELGLNMIKIECWVQCNEKLVEWFDKSMAKEDYITIASFNGLYLVDLPYQVF